MRLRGGMLLVCLAVMFAVVVAGKDSWEPIDLIPILVSEASRVQLPLQHTPLATCLSQIGTTLPTCPR